MVKGTVPDSVQGETVQVALGYHYTCALQADRRVVCWGYNDEGQTNVPASVQGEAVQIVAGWKHICAVLVNRKVVCWGLNHRDQNVVPDGLRVAS